MQFHNHPRRRSGTSSFILTSTREETFELLEENDSSQFITKEYENGTVRGVNRWLRFISVTFSVSLLIIIALRSSYIIFANPALEIPHFYSDIDTKEETIGIHLQPQNHVHRSPTTITHHWNITSGFRSPDGVRKLVYLVNDQFPGPTIECRSGDKLSIHVTNSLDNDGISIHWHGLEMRNSNLMDGAVGFTQCPIPPGQTFVYDFDVSEQAGTFWWHAHSQVQRGDGMYGGLIVHKPAHIIDEREVFGYESEVLLMVGDWYHRSADEVLEWYTSARAFGSEPVPDSLLVNGVGRFICSMAPPARPVKCVEKNESDRAGLLSRSFSSRSFRLRVVNVGSLAGFTLQISSTSLSPVTLDGGFYVKANASDSVGILYPGERVDIIVRWHGNSSPAASSFYVDLDPENLKYTNQALRPNQSFPFVYSQDTTGSEITPPRIPAINHFDLASATAAVSMSTEIPRPADKTILLYAKTQKLSIDGNRPTGFMNRTSWSVQSSPSLPLISLPRSNWDKNQLVPYIPHSDPSETWVDIIINNLDDGAHPFHLHGYSFYVLASYRSEHGWGSFSPYSQSASATVPSLNFLTPVKKDTVSVPRRGYVIIRFKADNVGIWMLHCHVLFHQASGMAMGIHVGGSEGHEKIDRGASTLCNP